MIGIFDSGYGGLTILDPIRRALPQYDYIYLGDNARAPYGSRSFQVIYEYTLQAVQHLFNEGCRLVVLACNTASAKALRTIQMHDINPLTHRVLGVIRPTVEAVCKAEDNRQERHIGVLGTQGTVTSQSYVIELCKQWQQHHGIDPLPNPAPYGQRTEYNGLIISQQACPMWVPLIESGEHTGAGADWFVKRYLQDLLGQDPKIDTILLACTHYPLLTKKIRDALHQLLPADTPKPELIAQGHVVAERLQDYLIRHPEIETTCSKARTCRFLTTENPDKFTTQASLFLTTPIQAEHIEL